MIGSSKLTTYVLAKLFIVSKSTDPSSWDVAGDTSYKQQEERCICWTSSVSGQGCNTTELSTIRGCIVSYGTQFPSYFGTGGTCNHTLMTQEVCGKYGSIVTCVNGASLSTTTCRPYMVSRMDSELGIPCKVNDFAVTCTSAPKINEGSGGASYLRSTGVPVIFVAMVTHVILAVFVFPVRNS